MRSWVTGVAVVALAAAAALPGADAAAPSPPAPTSLAVVERLAGAGVACERAEAARRSYVGELDEAHCRDYALARFADASRRAAWYARRAKEPWFPASWVVVAPRWVAWTSEADVAARIARAARARLLRLRLPAPVPHVTHLCEPTSVCSLPVASPVPVSPSGYVYSFPSQVWDAASTDTSTGLRVIPSGDPGTSTLTGILESSVGGANARGPLAGVRLTLRSNDPRLEQVTLSTVSDRWGGFAFTNLPAAAGGSCYVMTSRGGRLIAVAYAMLFVPDERYQVTWDAATPPGLGDSDSDKCSYP